jgi:hypothetical protein
VASADTSLSELFHIHQGVTTVQTDTLPTGRHAIVTKYHGPTNSRDSRVSATSQAGRVYFTYDPALSTDENHHAACRKLASARGWGDEWIPGWTPAGDCVWVQVPRAYQRAVEAVVATRLAMQKGDNTGNPWCKPYGRLVNSLTDDDDGIAPFFRLYQEAVKAAE